VVTGPGIYETVYLASSHRLASWPVCRPVCNWTQASDLFEGAPERCRVVVADTMSNLVDRVARCFEQALGVLDAGVLEVGLWCAPSRRDEPTRQRTATESELLSQLRDPQRLCDVPIYVLLDLV